jgi:hypothetical protein
MSEVEKLQAIREKLVAERRRIAALAVEQVPDGWGAEFKSVQEAIEVLDRAIADEGSQEFDPSTMVF